MDVYFFLMSVTEVTEQPISGNGSNRTAERNGGNGRTASDIF